MHSVCLQRIGTRTDRLGNKRTRRDHPNYSVGEIGQNTEKSPGDLRKLALTQTPVKTHRLMLMWKPQKGDRLDKYQDLTKDLKRGLKVMVESITLWELGTLMKNLEIKDHWNKKFKEKFRDSRPKHWQNFLQYWEDCCHELHWRQWIITNIEKTPKWLF